MKTIDLRLDQIKPYDKNPRRNDGAVDAVAESISTFGFQQPLVLDKDHVIIVGHTRYKAAQQLGLETVPCVVADGLTEEQVKAYRLADNKVGELAQWDTELLQLELDGLEMDMTGFGFLETPDFDVDDFFEDAEPQDEAPAAEDEPKEIQCPHCGMFFREPGA